MIGPDCVDPGQDAEVDPRSGHASALTGPQVLALLDLGSNAVRFFLAQIVPGAVFRVLREERVQTRLASGHRGALSASAVRATLEAAHGFLRGAPRGENVRVLAVATAAVRDAKNAADLLDPLKRKEGLDVRVLSENEEARLGAMAAHRSLPVPHATVLDLGGGSLQITRLRGESVNPMGSAPLGAVRATQRFLKHDPPTAAELRALRREVSRGVRDLLPSTERGAGMVGLGGNVLALGRMHLRTIRDRRTCLHALRLHRPDVTAIRERLQVLPLHRRRRLAGLESERADIVVAAAVMIEQIMDMGSYSTLTVCTRGVGYGVLVSETFGGVQLS